MMQMYVLPEYNNNNITGFIDDDILGYAEEISP